MLEKTKCIGCDMLHNGTWLRVNREETCRTKSLKSIPRPVGLLYLSHYKRKFVVASWRVERELLGTERTAISGWRFTLGNLSFRGLFLTGPLSSSEGRESLHAKLKQGIEEDNIYSDNKGTTCYVDWIYDFKMNLRKFGSNNQYWSQTECEMVVAGEAIRQVRMLMSGTGMSWARPIDEVRAVVETDTDERLYLDSVCDTACSSITDISINTDYDDRYTINLLREDSRKLSNDFDKYGITKGERMLAGIVLVVTKNKSLFLPNVVKSASKIRGRLEKQVEGSKKIAIRRCIEVGEKLGEAKVAGVMFDDYWETLLDEMEQEYPEAKGHILDGFNEVVE